MSVLRVPDMALVVLVGPSGSGKSTFARRCFAPTQILSSDAFRGMVADDENDQEATAPAFEALHAVAGLRLAGGRVTVVDATSVRREDRAHLVALARAHHVLPVAIVLDLPGSVCRARNAARTDRRLPPARRHPAARRPAPLAAPPGQGGLPARPRPALGRRGRRGDGRGRAPVQRPSRRDRAVRRRRRRPRLRRRAAGAALPPRLRGDARRVPVRLPWAADYRGRAAVVYGHVPTPEAEWINNTICLDTGAVFGGKLTALRYPERELVDVPAGAVWYEPTRPLRPEVAPRAEREPDVLDLDDVAGKRRIETAHHGSVTVPAEQAAAALEVMSRFAVDPRHLVYLPPTMAPPATSGREGLLEHPDEAFAAFHTDGVHRVVCQEKHMGSRAVVVVRRDGDGPAGTVTTRTGRPFFAPGVGTALLDRVRAAVTAAGLWDELATGWLLLDAEVLPWSAKAGPLVRERYAAVGAAALTGLSAAGDALAAAATRGVDVADLAARTRHRADDAAAFRDAYRRYCWPTDGLDGVRLAPFAVLAGEGAAYVDRDQRWHLDLVDRLVAADPELIRPTAALDVDTTDDASVAAGVAWWEELTAAGGEGMVVKSATGLVRGARRLAQPGIKVRGREYLRLVYGPDYTAPANLARLRDRSVGLKRSLALREYALGVEALERHARGEPLWRVHECVFAVLALESVPVDPQL